ncbi:MAG: Hsp20/alpha crystallin family protein [Phaeodactylibacter sp.]|nr:Hsp20/alpha crystallin family protein [Phaeodactylibacter sp.]
MTLIKGNSMFPAVPRFFDDLFTKDLFDWGFRNHSSATLPTVNIREDNEGFMVEMAAPGMDKSDFRIELDNETLTISSEKEWNKEMKEGERYNRHEFSYQAFSRSFHLPKTVVEEDKIKAKYENGILHILIPKREEAKAVPPRAIKVS